MTVKEIQTVLNRANLIVQEAALKARKIVEPLKQFNQQCPNCKNPSPNVGSGFNDNYEIHYLNYRCGRCGAFNITAFEGPHRVSEW